MEGNLRKREMSSIEIYNYFNGTKIWECEDKMPKTIEVSR